jgi:cystathionine beta-lyase/cystathionine gamma-synthase
VDTSHSTIPPEIRRSMGIEDGLVRFSTGIEDHEDLIADLQNALDALA